MILSDDFEGSNEKTALLAAEYHLPYTSQSEAAQALSPDACTKRRKPSPTARACFVTSALCVLLGVLALFTVRERETFVIAPPALPPVQYPVGPRESDGKVMACFSGDNGATHPNSSSSDRQLARTVELPLSAPELYFLSRGNTVGEFAVVPGKHHGDHVVVVVTMGPKMDQQALVDTSQLCLLEREGGARGVGIFTSGQDAPSFLRPEGRRSYLWWRIEVQVPNGAFVPSLHSELPNFTHALAGFSKHGETSFQNVSFTASGSPVLFERLEAAHVMLRTSDSFVTVGEILAKHISIVSENGPIQGVYTGAHLSFNSTGDSLEPIVVLRPDPDTGASLDLWNRDGTISSQILLGQVNETSGSGLITVRARTSRAPLYLNFPNTFPRASPVSVEAYTTHALAKVQVHPSYEGSLAARAVGPDVDVGVGTLRLSDPATGLLRNMSEEWDHRQDSDVFRGMTTWVLPNNGSDASTTRRRESSIRVEADRGSVILMV